jgi:hypothetical protein
MHFFRKFESKDIYKHTEEIPLKKSDSENIVFVQTAINTTDNIASNSLLELSK